MAGLDVDLQVRLSTYGARRTGRVGPGGMLGPPVVAHLELVKDLDLELCPFVSVTRLTKAAI